MTVFASSPGFCSFTTGVGGGSGSFGFWTIASTTLDVAAGLVVPGCVVRFCPGTLAAWKCMASPVRHGPPQVQP